MLSVFDVFGCIEKIEANIVLQIMFPGSVVKGPNSSSEEKSGGGLRKRWLVAEVVCAILPFVFISHFFILA
jgi:hypothetical protein